MRSAVYVLMASFLRHANETSKDWVLASHSVLTRALQHLKPTEEGEDEDKFEVFNRMGANGILDAVLESLTRFFALSWF